MWTLISEQELDIKELCLEDMIRPSMLNGCWSLNRTWPRGPESPLCPLRGKKSPLIAVIMWRGEAEGTGIIRFRNWNGKKRDERAEQELGCFFCLFCRTVHPPTLTLAHRKTNVKCIQIIKLVFFFKNAEGHFSLALTWRDQARSWEEACARWVCRRTWWSTIFRN